MMNDDALDDYNTFKFSQPPAPTVLFHRASTPTEDFAFSSNVASKDIESPQKRSRKSKGKHHDGQKVGQAKRITQRRAAKTTVIKSSEDEMRVVNSTTSNCDTAALGEQNQVDLSIQNTQESFIDQDYEEFEDRLTWDDRMFTRITAKLFVVTGWNVKEMATTVSKLYTESRIRYLIVLHLRRLGQTLSPGSNGG